MSDLCRDSSGRLFVPRFSIPGPRPDLTTTKRMMSTDGVISRFDLMLVGALIASIVLAVRSGLLSGRPPSIAQKVSTSFSGIVGDSML